MNHIHNNIHIYLKNSYVNIIKEFTINKKILNSAKKQ